MRYYFIVLVVVLTLCVLAACSSTKPKVEREPGKLYLNAPVLHQTLHTWAATDFPRGSIESAELVHPFDLGLQTLELRHPHVLQVKTLELRHPFHLKMETLHTATPVKPE